MYSLAILALTLSIALSVWSSPLSQACNETGSTCLLYETCCSYMGVNNSGCCPLTNAVCCEDQTHCCPLGFECSNNALLCQKQEVSSVKKIPIRRTTPLRLIERYGSRKPLESVTCKDQISVCADGNTCCKLESSMWGCCPLNNARCCEDGKHCCPKGYDCDEYNEGSCIYPNSTISMFPQRIKATLKYKALHKEDFVAIELYGVCTDKSVCPGNFTCCELGNTGEYGCCSDTNSVCCADRKSWCPQGYSCDLVRGECKQETTN